MVFAVCCCDGAGGGVVGQNEASEGGGSPLLLVEGPLSPICIVGVRELGVCLAAKLH